MDHERERDFVRYGLTRVKYRDIFATKETAGRDFVRVISKYQGEVTMEGGEASEFLGHLDLDTMSPAEAIITHGKRVPRAGANPGAGEAAPS